MPTPEHDRAGRSGRRQLHEAQVLVDDDVVIGVEADLVDVEGLGALDVGHRHAHEFELHIHVDHCSPRQDGLSGAVSVSSVGAPWTAGIEPMRPAW